MSQKAAVTVGRCSDATIEELNPFIGKEVAGIESDEHRFTVTLTDGSKIELIGWRWESASLGVETTGPEMAPCPFCGSQAEIADDEGLPESVFCALCGASGAVGRNKEDAIAKWNKRASA